MFTLYRTQGIVLAKKDRGEADRIFVFYTKDFGRLELLAKSERKIKSKLRAGLDIFYLSEVEFFQGKRQKTITDAILIDKFGNLRKSLEKLKVVYQISALAGKLLKGEEPENRIWRLFNEVLQKLDLPRTEGPAVLLLYHYFLWNFLSFLGYRLDFYNCFLCHKRITLGELFINPKEGGLVCKNCKKKVLKAESIDPDLVKIIRIFYKRDLPTLGRLRIKESALKDLNSMSKKYLSGVLEKTQ
jgi:DNA repair protein RecO (recombination protein O)